ncbi:hypothetical protein CRM22_011340 [Opisthorchis felineus]|uniref:Peptidase A1 domain-containing protein n=1 Tax=Opisthorchis felineus TaxID=147828 RepID=A0A4S2JR89_OPIFE|nr:hypothetical protein CRM22_011340 [Opisthorchis felineus]
MVPFELHPAGWRLDVLGLSTPARRISAIGFSATLDSTSWLNKASVDRARLINTALGAMESGDEYIVDCNRMKQLPALIISFHGLDLSLSLEKYVQKEDRSGQTHCFSSVVPDPGIRNENMVLGMAFMEHFLTMFDQEMNKVGFQERLC